MGRRREEASGDAFRIAGLVITCQALGLIAMALAGSAGRGGDSSWAETAFWLGLLLIVGPTTARLASAAPERTERIILALGVGLTLYLAKVLIWPVQFTFHDEFVNWRTTADIISSHHLFLENPLTPVSASYPGSSVVTAGVAQISGLSVFVSGLIVVGAARIVLMLSLYLVLERVTGSSRAAGLACVVYAANPNFLFFDAQFGYESLSIALGAFLVYLALRPLPSHVRPALPGVVALVLVAAALASSHHLTSWLFAAGLTAAVVISCAVRRRPPFSLPESGLAVAAVAAIATAGLWLVYVGVGAVSYVGPVLTGGGNGVLHLIEGDAAPRTLFVSAEQVSPKWEQILSFGSVAIILIALPFGLVMVWRHYRSNPYLLFLGGVAALYPASLALRLTSTSTEISARLSEFLFFGVAGILGLLASRALRDGVGQHLWPGRRLALCVTVAITLAVGGGAIISWGRWARLPGSYLVSADARSVEPQGEEAAAWAETHLGSGNRIAADRVNGLLMGSPLGGEQHPINGLADGINVNSVILSKRITNSDLQKIADAGISYVVTDARLSDGLPLTGVYVNRPEWTASNPVSPLAAAKFGRAPQFNRLFDSGDIKVYSRSMRGWP